MAEKKIQVEQGINASGVQDVINAIKASNLTSCYLLYQVLVEARGEKAGYERFKADWLRTYYSTLKIVEKLRRRSGDRA
ncbi:MAG: hypothetical protein A2Y95_08540 [Deltaproteobacteria bacterium RBG_13_65_10]|nr:MAG: hypothetical protein A2Y95_08540 [Deltaproteobacteria bacterium RBG_13_65_10]